jgi:preprotein translocase subunit YajC
MAALIPLVLMLGVMWMLLIRPQQQRVRAHQALVQSLAIGDEVVTAGGIFGRIQTLEGDEAQLEIAPGISIRVLRAAVNRKADEPMLEQPNDNDDSHEETGP